jgi:hypothetical protein
MFDLSTSRAATAGCALNPPSEVPSCAPNGASSVRNCNRPVPRFGDDGGLLVFLAGRSRVCAHPHRRHRGGGAGARKHPTDSRYNPPSSFISNSSLSAQVESLEEGHS